MDMLSRLRTYFQTIDSAHYVDLLPVAATHGFSDTSHDVPYSSTDTVSTLILACTASSLHPALTLPGLDYVVLTQHSSIADIQEGLDANAQGFDATAAPATEAEAEAFRQTLITNCAFTGRYNQQPAAAGMFTSPVNGVSEIVGITTLAAYRRRGIAAALTSEVVRVAFEYGVEVAILSASNPEAYRIYTRIGFAPAGLLLKRHEANNEQN